MSDKIVASILLEGRQFNPYVEDGITGYTARGLVETYHYLKTHPDETIWVGRWPAEPMTWAEWRAWFRDCLNAKINRNKAPRGKKDSAEYEADLRHDVRLIREFYATRARWCGRNVLRTPEAKRKYPHIDNYGMDD